MVGTLPYRTPGLSAIGGHSEGKEREREDRDVGSNHASGVDAATRLAVKHSSPPTRGRQKRPRGLLAVSGTTGRFDGALPSLI